MQRNDRTLSIIEPVIGISLGADGHGRSQHASIHGFTCQSRVHITIHIVIFYTR